MQRITIQKTIAAWLSGSGLLLLVMGYWCTTFIPLTQEECDKENHLQNIQLPIARQLEAQNPSEENRRFREELEASSVKYHKVPPYRGVGLISFTFGGFAFVLGLWLWFGQKPKHRWVSANDDV